MDEYSDLDLIVVVKDESYEAVMAERFAIVKGLGATEESLLAAFTGEHVCEPRLIISLFGNAAPNGAPLHVDVKFSAIKDMGPRVEEPFIFWERTPAALSDRLRSFGPAAWPAPDLQWVEDRFWVWTHYFAVRLARGELFECVDSLSFLRANVFGPLCLKRCGFDPQGVRRLETRTPQYLDLLKRTVGGYDQTSLLVAIRASIDLYRQLRSEISSELATPFAIRGAAEATAVAYLDAIGGAH